MLIEEETDRQIDIKIVVHYILTDSYGTTCVEGSSGNIFWDIVSLVLVWSEKNHEKPKLIAVPTDIRTDYLQSKSHKLRNLVAFSFVFLPFMNSQYIFLFVCTYHVFR
jgi:hypothetical protein